MDHDIAADGIRQPTQADLAEGYRLMAADREQELEAKEWTEQILFEVE